MLALFSLPLLHPMVACVIPFLPLLEDSGLKSLCAAAFALPAAAKHLEIAPRVMVRRFPEEDGLHLMVARVRCKGLGASFPPLVPSAETVMRAWVR